MLGCPRQPRHRPFHRRPWLTAVFKLGVWGAQSPAPSPFPAACGQGAAIPPPQGNRPERIYRSPVILDPAPCVPGGRSARAPRQLCWELLNIRLPSARMHMRHPHADPDCGQPREQLSQEISARCSIKRMGDAGGVHLQGKGRCNGWGSGYVGLGSLPVSSAEGPGLRAGHRA